MHDCVWFSIFLIDGVHNITCLHKWEVNNLLKDTLLVIGYCKFESVQRWSLSRYIHTVGTNWGCDLFNPDRMHYSSAMTATPFHVVSPLFLSCSHYETSAGFCRWCSWRHVRCGVGVMLFSSNGLKYGAPVVAAPMCSLLLGGNYFRWRGRHHCLMLSDWVLLNYSNKPFRGLTRSAVSFIKSEGEWFVNGLHFMAQ